MPLGLGTVDFGALYRDRIEPLARQKREATRLPLRIERFPIALGVALMLAVVAGRPRGRLPIARANVRICVFLAAVALGASPFETPSARDRRRRAILSSRRFFASEVELRGALTIAQATRSRITIWRRRIIK